MGETTPFTPHCPYLGLFILLILGPLELPFPEDGILILGGILVTRSFIKVLPTFRIVYPGLLMTDLLLHSVGRGYSRKRIDNKKFKRMISAQVTYTTQ